MPLATRFAVVRKLSRRLPAVHVDLLEPRRVFHAGHAASIPHDVLSADYVWTANEHIPRSLFEQLPAATQATIDPHFIEEDNQLPVYPSPGFKIITDNQLTRAASKPGAGGSGSSVDPNAPALPDFVPKLDGTPYIEQTNSAFPGRSLLRFGTAVNNEGVGPATLVGGPVNADGTQTVFQRLYNYNPVARNFTAAGDRVAGRFTYHAAHSHTHFDGYARYRLLQNVGGTAGGVAMRNDGTQVDGEKVGFCLININSSFTMLNGLSSTTIPSYGASGQPSTGCGSLQGISVGYADIYSASLDGQWIDITGVPNGEYFIEITLDANNGVLESNEVNNTGLFAFTVSNNNATGSVILADRFDQQAAGGPNNSFARATNLGIRGTATEAGLTAHSASDDDYFRFIASSSGSATVQTLAASGDVDLYVYDSNFVELGRSTVPRSGTTNNIAVETVTVNFVRGQTYYALTNVFNERLSSNYAFVTNLKPAIDGVSVTQASEAGNSAGRFTLSRNGPVTSTVTVNYTVSGTATAGVDYVALPGSIVFDAESSTKTIDIIPLSDSFIESGETIIITITPNSNYAVGVSPISITLADLGPAVTSSAFANQRSAAETSFNFSLDVNSSFDPGDVIATNRLTGQTFPASSVSYVTGTNRGTAFFDALPDGNYRAGINPAGVTHALGAPLQAAASVDFFVLSGDVNNNRIVDFDDLVILARNFNTSGKLFSEGNVNRDPLGLVDFQDLVLIARNFNRSLLPPVAPILLGSSSKGRDSSDLLR